MDWKIRPKTFVKRTGRRFFQKGRHLQALAWHRWYWLHYRFQLLSRKWGGKAVPAAITLWILNSIWVLSHAQGPLAHYFSDKDAIDDFQAFMLAIGGALIGATAIAFSFIMFAMQVNVERMPHGLFRKFSSDRRLMFTFIAGFLLAISIASASLVSNPLWIAKILWGTAWAILLIVIGLLYAYRRALLLINPVYQLSLVVADAQYEMKVWSRRAKRAAVFFEQPEEQESEDTHEDTVDLTRAAYFKRNPYWTVQSERSIQYIVSYARRYAEKGDHEVSAAALQALVQINALYVGAKGKTFFSDTVPFLENPLVTDGFINNSLEHLRQNIQIGTARRDEQQLTQTLRAFAALIQIYVQIEYPTSYGTKTHAHLASGYMSDAVMAIIPHNMPDVIMEGVRLMGQSAQLFLAHGKPEEIATLVGKIGVLACAGVANEKFRPVTRTAIDHLTKLTCNLLVSQKHDVQFAFKEIKSSLTMAATMYLNIQDTPLMSLQSYFLAPYYSYSGTFLPFMANLTNELSKLPTDNDTAKKIIRNIHHWADGLYQPLKELLLAAISKESQFTFDIIHWIDSISKVLLAVSNAPACKDYYQEELRKHALWLISTLSWVPDDKKSVAFIENYRMTEVLFESALDGYYRECEEFAETAQKLLMDWAFKAGKHHIGWAILERSIYGLATLALQNSTDADATILKHKLTERLGKPEGPDQEMRDRSARNIRRHVMELHNDRHSLSKIEHALSQVPHKRLKPLLTELANILSPNTQNEKIRRHFF